MKQSDHRSKGQSQSFCLKPTRSKWGCSANRCASEPICTSITTSYVVNKLPPDCLWRCSFTNMQKNALVLIGAPSIMRNCTASALPPAPVACQSSNLLMQDACILSPQNRYTPAEQQVSCHALSLNNNQTHQATDDGAFTLPGFVSGCSFCQHSTQANMPSASFWK